MKFYNPFKAHIVQFENKYLVRRFNCMIWEYKEINTLRDEKPNWWYLWENALRYCSSDSYQEAVKVKDKVWVNPNKTPKLKVVHG